MKIVESINKLIIKKVIEIVFVICFVCVATVLWQNKNTQNLFSSVAAFQEVKNTTLKVADTIDYRMYPMQDEVALKTLSPCYLTVENATNTKEEYALVLIIDKKSSLDYRYLNISVGEKVFTLMDLEQREDEEEILFILSRDALTSDKKE